MSNLTQRQRDQSNKSVCERYSLHTSDGSPRYTKSLSHIFTREAKEEVIEVLLGEVTDAAAKLRRDRAEHRPDGGKARRCRVEVGYPTTSVAYCGHEPKVG
jgi:hypothetical protein